jgi:hypothetical protein
MIGSFVNPTIGSAPVAPDAQSGDPPGAVIGKPVESDFIILVKGRIMECIEKGQTLIVEGLSIEVDSSSTDC